MKTYSRLLLGFALLGLVGCSDSKEFFGLNPQAPDEFMVVDHPSLAMPPDFALKPPRPGVSAISGDNPSEKAAKALYGADKMELVPEQGSNSLQVQALSPAEQMLVSQSGADKADPHIRAELDRESKSEVVGDRKLIDTLLFWKAAPEKGTVVDAVAERDRLAADKAKGAPDTAGATPAANPADKPVAVE